MIAIIASVFSTLVTFLVSSLSSRYLLKKMVQEEIKHHNEVFHQDSMYEYVETEIKKHETECIAHKDFDAIKRALIFLVTKQNGSPMELGL